MLLLLPWKRFSQQLITPLLAKPEWQSLEVALWAGTALVDELIPGTLSALLTLSTCIRAHAAQEAQVQRCGCVASFHFASELEQRCADIPASRPLDATEITSLGEGVNAGVYMLFDSIKDTATSDV